MSESTSETRRHSPNILLLLRSDFFLFSFSFYNNSHRISFQFERKFHSQNYMAVMLKRNEIIKKKHKSKKQFYNSSEPNNFIMQKELHIGKNIYLMTIEKELNHLHCILRCLYLLSSFRVPSLTHCLRSYHHRDGVSKF